MARDLLRRLKKAKTPKGLHAVFRDLKRKRDGLTAHEMSQLLQTCGFTVRHRKHDVWSGHGKTVTIPRPKSKHLKGPYVDGVVKILSELADERPEVFFDPTHSKRP